MNELWTMIRRKVIVRNGHHKWVFERSRWLKVLLFVSCGVLGLLVLMVSTFQLFVSLYDPSVSDVHIHPLMLMITAAIGGLLMLAGVGLWRQWAYLLVFAVIPGSLFLVVMVNPGGPATSLTVATIVALCTFAVLYVVRSFYRKRSEREHQGDKPS